MKLDEQSLKCRLLSLLRKEKSVSESSIIASEFVLGRSGRRSDLAIWNGSSFIGVEIKSARDSLARLPSQIDAYRRFFDKVIVLCDEVHLTKVNQLCDPNVGVYVWTDGARIEAVRNPNRNDFVDRKACIKAITLRQLQLMLGVKSTARIPRSELEKMITADKLIDVRSALISSFEARYRPTSHLFWENVNGKKISEYHLSLLSRFSSTRKSTQILLNARQEFWQAWSRQAEAAFG